MTARLATQDVSLGGIGGGGGPSLTADAIARLVGGSLVGDGSLMLRAVAPLDRAAPHELSLYASPKYAAQLARSAAGAILTAPGLADAPGGPRTRIIVEQPYEALLHVLGRLYPPASPSPGVHSTAVVGLNVSIGSDVYVGPCAVVGDGVGLGDRVRIGPHCVIEPDVTVGDDSELHASVILHAGARVGRRVRLHSGVRVATDGFGYVYRDGAHQKLPHVGRCIIEDDVEIGANSCIDRGSIDDTIIGAGTKIDNLVHIAHNVRIGRLCLIMAQVGIAGSVRVEDGCVVAGQAGIAGHHTIGKGARLAARAGVFGDVPAGETWSGYPARPHREQLRAHAALLKLAGMIRQLERLVNGGGGDRGSA